MGCVLIVIVLVGILLIAIAVASKVRRPAPRPRTISSTWLDQQRETPNYMGMSGVEFEHFVAALYESLGYQVTVTPASHDNGVDVVARQDGRTYAIQAKRVSRPVGSPVLQRLWGASGHYRVDGAICISTCGFTTHARAFAQGKAIELIDGAGLTALIRKSAELADEARQTTGSDEAARDAEASRETEAARKPREERAGSSETAHVVTVGPAVRVPCPRCAKAVDRYSPACGECGVHLSWR